MSKNSFSLVVFDLDGTLYPLTFSFRTYFFASLLSTYSLWKAHRTTFTELRGKRFENGEMLCAEHMEMVAEKTGKPVRMVKEWYFEHFYSVFIRAIRNKVVLRPHFMMLLRSLKKKGVASAVLSDYGKINERLAALRVESDLFDITISGEEFGVLKPGTDAVLHIAETLSVSPERTLIIGDKEESDGALAQKTGMSKLILGTRKDNGKVISWDDVHRVLSEVSN